VFNFLFFVSGTGSDRHGTESDDGVINRHPLRAIRHKDGDSVSSADALVSQINGDSLRGGFKMAVSVLVFAVCQGNLVLKIQRAVIDNVGKIQDNFLFMESRFGFPAKMSLKKCSFKDPEIMRVGKN
jgi:hypothetical protein